MPQVKLHGFFATSPPKAPEVVADLSEVVGEDSKIKNIVAGTSTSGLNREEALRQHSEEVGMEFVKNGSRDRWGQLRQNIGGRPKKKRLALWNLMGGGQFV